jgi:opacity protein-like surface antigen
MMRGSSVAAVIVLGGLLSSSPAEAQTRQRLRGFGFSGFAQVDRHAFIASETFDAVMQDASGTLPGGGGQLRWRQLVFEVSASRYKRTGQRVFISGGQVFRLGIPTTVTVTPIEFTGAYRLPAIWRFVPYGGGGVVRLQYKETSQFAEASENVKESFNGYHVMGGAEIPVWKWFAAAVEGRYRSVPDAIGTAGVSNAFGEDDLGGASVRVKFIVGR